MLVTPGSERVNVISNLPFEHVITMDASLVGCPLEEIGNGECKCHINYLEMLAVYLGLQTFA